MNKNIEGVGEVNTPSTPKEKLQNFWYHYKWHSVVAVVLVIAILICSLQFCTRESYDAYVLYAGSKIVGRTSAQGDVPEISKMIPSLRRIASDFDEDGERSVNFSTYYYLSSDETANLGDVNEALLMNDRKALTSVMEHSEYYLLFISEAVYEEYKKAGDEDRFIDLGEFENPSRGIKFYADDAIYLSSTPARQLQGLINLPADTLVCIRRPSVLGAKSREHQEHLENAKQMLHDIIYANFKR